VLLGIAAIFYALHFVHLRADFPNHSPWMDWAKYTDEGWYGDAAIRHYLWGHWNLPGDFNPAAALPVWPLIELALFRFTGVSLVAARALTVVIFGLILIACYHLVRRWTATQAPGAFERSRHVSLAPALAVLLLATNPFCYVFTRMAILEPLLVLLTLCALLLADNAGHAAIEPAHTRNRRLFSAAALGVVLPLILLTKTTGLFLFPAIFFALWGAARQEWKPFFRTASVSCGVAAALWLAYYGLFVRPHYLTDYQYLFSANTYTKITLATFWTVLHDTLLDGTWIGDALFWSSLLALVGWIAVSAARRFRGSPLPIALVLWVLGYAAFLAYHANFAPRYYTVIAVPLILLLAMGFDVLLRLVLPESPLGAGHTAWTWFLRIAAAGSTITLLVILINGSRQTLRYARHPQYSFLTAGHRLHDAVQRELAIDPHHSRLVLSISGSDISLVTGLPSICDDFGTMELPDRVAAYKPGWFAAWNNVEDDKMAALAPMYRLVKVGTYPAYDDPERNLLVLYRLDPLNSPRRGRSGRRRYFVNPHQRKSRKPPAAPAIPR
jgi:4-amino-4-deoxy-L-arabinose transferase-like glycosyltransferase